MRQKTAMPHTDNPESQLSKAQLRGLMRSRRSELSATAREAGHLIAQHITKLPQWHAVARVALYYAADGEVETDAIARLCRAQGKLTYLPVVLPEKLLAFSRWHENGVLQANRFGIPEPPADAERCAVAELDVVLLPLVGWDRNGTRLGMGGGFYDRTLADKPQNKPLLVGLGYGQQEVAELPRQSWDVCLDFVITERGLHSVGSPREGDSDHYY